MLKSRGKIISSGKIPLNRLKAFPGFGQTAFVTHEENSGSKAQGEEWLQKDGVYARFHHLPFAWDIKAEEGSREAISKKPEQE